MDCSLPGSSVHGISQSKNTGAGCHFLGVSQVALVVKNLPASEGDVRDTDLIPGSRRPPGGVHGKETDMTEAT